MPSIRISEKTKNRIEKHGKYGDSIDSILVRILDEYEKKKPKGD